MFNIHIPSRNAFVQRCCKRLRYMMNIIQRILFFANMFPYFAIRCVFCCDKMLFIIIISLLSLNKTFFFCAKRLLFIPTLGTKHSCVPSVASGKPISQPGNINAALV